MNRSQAFPSKYLKKDDVLSPITVTIRRVELGEVGIDENAKSKPIVYFREQQIKPLIIGAGNWDIVAELYGDDSDGWSGKPITIYVDPSVKFAGKRTGGLRVRAPEANGDGSMPALPLAINNPVLMSRWADLLNQAYALGLEIAPLPDDATVAQAIERGQALKAQIEAAQQMAEPPF